MTDKPEPARLEPGEEPGTAVIIRGDRRVTLRGFFAQRALAWHAHMRTHGEAEARIYLAGLVDGLGAASEARMQEIMDGAAARRSQLDADLERLRERRLDHAEDPPGPTG
jgi:hypothetical protein